jgi:hypothetical protein
MHGTLIARFDEHGWDCLDPRRVSRERCVAGLEHARWEYAGRLAGFRLGGPSCHALRETLALCKAEGIQAALVLMPEGAEFRSWYPAPVWSQVVGFLDQIARESNATVINAQDWVADANFLDSHHLLSPGAAIFSRHLASRIPIDGFRSSRTATAAADARR